MEKVPFIFYGILISVKISMQPWGQGQNWVQEWCKLKYDLESYLSNSMMKKEL